MYLSYFNINYTNETDLRNFLKAGKGQITVTLSLPEDSGITDTTDLSKLTGKAYRINGTLANAGDKSRFRVLQEDRYLRAF